MPYDPIVFEDKPARTTPLTAAALAFMQTQHPQAVADILAQLGGAPVADNDHRYRLVACALRNTGSGWDFIQDSGHEPIGANDVSVSDGFVRVALDFVATRVASLVVGVDETFVLSGITAGPSVALDTISIQLGKVGGNHDYVSWNGSAWVSSTGFVTGTTMNGTTGVIRFTHAEVPDPLGGNVQLRSDGANRGSMGGMTSTSCDILTFPYNSATSLKTPTTDLRFFVQRTGVRKMDPADVVSASGNLWVLGVLEVA